MRVGVVCTLGKRDPANKDERVGSGAVVSPDTKCCPGAWSWGWPVPLDCPALWVPTLSRSR